MDIKTILILLLFLTIIFHQIRCMRNLVIPTKKRAGEITATIMGAIVLLGITYVYADVWIHYIVGILASGIIILALYKNGITLKGFSCQGSQIGHIAFIPWDKIKRVQISRKKYVVVSFSGRGHNKLCFNKDDYDEVVGILEENLSPEVIEIK